MIDNIKWYWFPIIFCSAFIVIGILAFWAISHAPKIPTKTLVQEPIAGVTEKVIGSIKVPPTETYFAEIDANGTVLRVIVADQAFINSGKVGDPKNWIETRYDGSIKGAPAIRGEKYDKTLDIFIDTKKQAPLPMPIETATTTKR